MDKILRFQPHWRVEAAGDGRVYLVGEHERFVLGGGLYARVAPFVDGRRTVLEIVEALEDDVAPPEVLYALTALEQRGYLVETVPGQPAEVAAFWRSLGADAASASARLAATPVAVLPAGDEDPGPLVEALAGAGVVVREDAAVRVVVAGDYLDCDLEAINRRAIHEGFRWMPVKPGGATPWIGPLFRPRDGACWACLAHRLRENRPVETFVERSTGRGAAITPPRAALRTSARAAADLAALVVARWIVDGGRGAVDTKLLAMRLAPLAFEEHAVVRRPQCPACGDPGLMQRRGRRPVVLGASPKRFTDDGGHRCRTPEETYTRCAHHVSPITGLVSSLGPLGASSHPLRPVYGAAFFAPADGAAGFGDFHQVTRGKGRSAEQARASALCEAVERYSGLFQGDEPRVEARLDELGDDAVHPAALLGFSDRQYRMRQALDAACRDPRHRIPKPFDESRRIDWTPCWSLTRARRRYLPTAHCYFRYPVRPDDGLCAANSNGHAAGNCMEEAILQGLLELVERDAAALWWYNRLPRPAVDLASFGEAYFDALEAHYRSLGWPIWVLDLTHDLGIPAFVALGRSAATGAFCVGFGAHLSPRIGVQRALTELNQVFDPGGERPPPWDAGAVPHAGFLLPAPGLAPRRAGDLPEVGHADLRDDVEHCVTRAARAGLEVLVLDQTRPDTGLTVVKVVVPGLRHVWPRLGPGRLYDVPVQLGWLERPLDEAELNPEPLLI